MDGTMDHQQDGSSDGSTTGREQDCEQQPTSPVARVTGKIGIKNLDLILNPNKRKCDSEEDEVTSHPKRIYRPPTSPLTPEDPSSPSEPPPPKDPPESHPHPPPPNKLDTSDFTPTCVVKIRKVWYFFPRNEFF